jgi:glycogen debranching enzyme
LLTDFDERQARWQTRCTALTTPNDHVYRIYRQAVEDMGALRIYDLDVSDEAWVPAAGVPWFVTLFGRDSLIVSLQNMSVSAGFACGALNRLAADQATERDDWRDAQPGKILLSETYRWTGDVDLLRAYQAVAEQCLHWIDHDGDLDGDGFQEYQTFSPHGYENMSWKDAADAVVYADGRQVKQPKALCELQGYVYDAKLRMAEVFQALGDEARARALLQQAGVLKQQFHQAFWMKGALRTVLTLRKHRSRPLPQMPVTACGAALPTGRRPNAPPGDCCRTIYGAAGVSVRSPAGIPPITRTSIIWARCGLTTTASLPPGSNALAWHRKRTG